MALGVETSDGLRKITLTTRAVSGAPLDLTAIQIQPILRPYTVFAQIRGETAAGDVFEMDLTWQAVPKTPETADIGPRMGLMPETEGG